MEVQILSKKMVKPEVPTPYHLRTCNLSFFDQLVAPEHIPIIYFYQNHSNDTFKIREVLVKSLSKTLTQFYPFAGRFVLDGFYVDCNDEGVLFIDAEVNLQLDDFLDKARKDMHVIDDLVPLPSYGEAHSFATPLVGLQVSSFKCGGVAIGMCTSHVLIDGITSTLFIKEWAATTNGLFNGQLISSSWPSFGFASVFPSRDLPAEVEQAVGMFTPKEDKVITKRFLFDGKALDKLKDDIHNKLDNQLNRPTRVDIVTSIIWRALIRISKLQHHTLCPSINLRGRTSMTAPLDDGSTCGNFGTQVRIKFKAKNKSYKVEEEEEEELELHHIVKLLKSGVYDAIENYSKISDPDALFLEASKFLYEFLEDIRSEEVEVYELTSLCRMPFYESDFGWGKPEWVTIPSISMEMVFLMDTKCGKGIEAIVNLSESEMLQFERDPTIVAFTSV